LRHLLPRKQRGPAASLYTKYLPLGSLADIWQRIARRKQSIHARHADAGPAAVAAKWRLPKAFIWDVFISLARALVYLATGSDSSQSSTDVKDSAPMSHGDITPDNVFLRDAAAVAGPQPRRKAAQRRLTDGQTHRPAAAHTYAAAAADAKGAASLQSADEATEPAAAAAMSASATTPAKYPEIALGNFGRATIGSRGDSSAAQHRHQQTRVWWALQGPELPLLEGGGRSDVGSVGTVAQYLCTGDMLGTLSRAQWQGYSAQLVEAIRVARHPGVNRRPDARGMLQLVGRLLRRAAPPYEHLPPWALHESADDTLSAYDDAPCGASSRATEMERQTATDGLDNDSKKTAEEDENEDDEDEAGDHDEIVDEAEDDNDNVDDGAKDSSSPHDSSRAQQAALVHDADRARLDVVRNLPSMGIGGDQRRGTDGGRQRRDTHQLEGPSANAATEGRRRGRQPAPANVVLSFRGCVIGKLEMYNNTFFL
jgi:hypothetical protein